MSLFRVSSPWFGSRHCYLMLLYATPPAGYPVSKVWERVGHCANKVVEGTSQYFYSVHHWRCATTSTVNKQTGQQTAIKQEEMYIRTCYKSLVLVWKEVKTNKTNVCGKNTCCNKILTNNQRVDTVIDLYKTNYPRMSIWSHYNLI